MIPLFPEQREAAS